MTTTIERRVRVVRDETVENPREDWDCFVGRMLCWHSRYNLGDDHNYDSDDWKFELGYEADDNLADRVACAENDVYNVLYECAMKDLGYDSDDAHDYAIGKVNRTVAGMIDRAFDAGFIALPLYLYDHSGITMNTGGFNCPWDSGCVGVIVCDRETIKREFNGDEEKAYAALRVEVETYDQYLTGDVWGFIAEEREVDDDSDLDDDEGWEHVDSCFGFYGSDPKTNGMADHLGDEFTDCEVCTE